MQQFLPTTTAVPCVYQYQQLDLLAVPCDVLLLQLLNKQHLADALEVSEMLDGVVMFESDHDADRFARMLEEEGHNQVGVGSSAA